MFAYVLAIFWKSPKNVKNCFWNGNRVTYTFLCIFDVCFCFSVHFWECFCILFFHCFFIFQTIPQQMLNMSWSFFCISKKYQHHVQHVLRNNMKTYESLKHFDGIAKYISKNGLWTAWKSRNHRDFLILFDLHAVSKNSFGELFDVSLRISSIFTQDFCVFSVSSNFQKHLWILFEYLFAIFVFFLLLLAASK